MAAKSQATLQSYLSTRGLAGMDPGEIDDLLDSIADLATFQTLTAGTVTASKPVVVDANKDIATFRHLTLSGNIVVGSTTISETDLQAIDGVIATPAEINRACDVSTRVVSLAATSLAVSEATHSDKVIVLNHTGASSTATLPAATGSGAVIRFIVGTVNTSNHIITVTGDDTLKGQLLLTDEDGTTVVSYVLTGTDDTITLNGTTTGGQIGDWVECVDVKADVWAVRGTLRCAAGSNVADPTSGS
jgi:hypothetical protein